jgi:hypothetical protein
MGFRHVWRRFTALASDGNREPGRRSENGCACDAMRCDAMRCDEMRCDEMR